MIETYRGVVYPHQIDHMGHMNVQWYVSKFDEATWHLFSSVGITTDYIRNDRKGMAALEQTIKYRAELLEGDPVFIKSRVLEVSDKTLRFFHVMYHAESGEKVADTELLAIHLDRDKRKSCYIPESIREKSRELMDNI